jgi:hypothetical protein
MEPHGPFTRLARPEQIDHKRNNQSAEIQHPAEDHPIVRFKPTGWNLRQGQVRSSGLTTVVVKKSTSTCSNHVRCGPKKQVPLRSYS